LLIKFQKLKVGSQPRQSSALVVKASKKLKSFLEHFTLWLKRRSVCDQSNRDQLDSVMESQKESAIDEGQRKREQQSCAFEYKQ